MEGFKAVGGTVFHIFKFSLLMVLIMKEKLVARIVLNPKIHHGKPIFRGTRVPVEVVLGAMAGGMDAHEVCEEYGVAMKDVQAALEYAYLAVSNEEIKLLAEAHS